VTWFARNSYRSPSEVTSAPTAPDAVGDAIALTRPARPPDAVGDVISLTRPARPGTLGLP
jgi:hypothetical protein